ncbi:MAG: pantoate--beta-alanine ligase [Pseudobdellovibrionaceae bacterium]
MALVIRTTKDMLEWRKSVEGRSVGFVPTMGALHLGHEALIQKARAENELLVLSIYVNPTQFNDKSDFEKYPATWDADLKLAEKNRVDVVFAPIYSEMYPDQYSYKVIETDFSKKLCGANRPGHFDGVLTVVMRLLNLVRPEKAYFGEKDFQQLSLIQGMVKAFFLSTEIVPVETVREKDGLAMSSRNVRLFPRDREMAPLIHRVLKTAKSPLEAIQEFEKQNWKVDYVTDFSGRRFAAVYVGEVRLIDNVKI